MSLSQPGSHEEISLITDLDLSDTSGVTRLHAVRIPCTGPVDRIAFFVVRRLLRCSKVDVKVSISSLSSVRTTGQHLPTSLLDGPVLCSQFLASTPDTHPECSMQWLLTRSLQGYFSGSVLKSSGVFFLKRNDDVGKGRIDPRLRESLTLKVAVSRCRRHLRPRTGFVRALMDVALQT